MTSKSDPSSTSAETAIETPAETPADRALTETYRSDWGRLLSLLVTGTRRLDLAEDALAEAFARAGARWPVDGVPDNPSAWLYTTARRVMVGRLRSEGIHGRKAPLLAARPDWNPPAMNDQLGDLDDERLALILLCCHPALDPGARSALALRLVIGTPTGEIGRLFLVSPATMAARITRAKKKIVVAGIPLSTPVDAELASRLDDVCRTIYLAFTAGYAPGSGPDLIRADLAGEAVELAAVLHRLVPSAAQTKALLGLLLLQHARRDARVENGRLITLDKQDRSAWNQEQIRVGTRLVAGVAAGDGYTEALRLQGLIAAEHGRAVAAEDTDWPTISELYTELETVTGSPVVRLNRAVAVGESDGPHAGLAILDGLDAVLGHSHRLAAVRADLAERAGDIGLARRSYEVAIERCGNEVERRFLLGRLAAIGHFGPLD